MGPLVVFLVPALLLAFQCLYPFLVASGISRTIELLGNGRCHTFPELAACEKIVQHPSSGGLYLACSTRPSRLAWTPTLMQFNSSGMSTSDHVSTFHFNRKDPSKSSISKLKFQGLTRPSLHGMDIHFPSATVILINHRAPTDDEPWVANSVIEWLTLTDDGTTLIHRYTFDSPAISTPNDVAFSEDGQGFWFTNDFGAYKSGWVSFENVCSVLLPAHATAIGSLGYCSLKSKTCELVHEKLMYPNGVARKDNQLIVASAGTLGITYVMDIVGKDGSVSLNTTFVTGHLQDNVSIDSEGSIWLATFPHAYKATQAWQDLNSRHPTSALKVTSKSNTYTVEKIFEDDGNLVSSATSAVFDPQEKLLYLSGSVSPDLTVCEL
ncbi:hypothetical protein DL96DRAFT_1604968 [Flagelloscypha sp. PMI_526]|nr:hypothetical protein DL96DRAFT_1604968 [Flagelloscypha sp. PMI_526]